jgi:trimeric autotransporter adhesin
VAALTTAQIDKLTATQIGALTTSQVAALSTTQLNGLSSFKIDSLSTTQLQALTTTQMQGFTTTQLTNLMDKTSSFTTTQLGVLSGDQVLALATPLVLDLNADGLISTLSISDGVSFDLNSDGKLNRTGWVGSGDGLLVRDLNGDGVINNGSELFGEFTKLADGSTARDGFEALADLDTNGDGWVTADDDAFASLAVWIDANADGITGAGELRSLADLGIVGISVSNVSVNPSVDASGNVIALQTTFTREDGTSSTVADVWFQTDLSSDEKLVNSLADALERYSLAAADAGGFVGGGEAGMGVDEKLRLAMLSFSSTGQPVNGWASGSSNDGALLSEEEKEKLRNLQQGVVVNPLG